MSYEEQLLRAVFCFLAGFSWAKFLATFPKRRARAQEIDEGAEAFRRAAQEIRDGRLADQLCRTCGHPMYRHLTACTPSPCMGAMDCRCENFVEPIS